MAASLGPLGCVSRCVFYLMLSLELLSCFGLSSDAPCPQNCTCSGDSVDCSGLELTVPPADLPVWTVSLGHASEKTGKTISSRKKRTDLWLSCADDDIITHIWRGIIYYFMVFACFVGLIYSSLVSTL